MEQLPVVIIEENGMGFLMTPEDFHQQNRCVDEIGEIWHYFGMFTDEDSRNYHLYRSSQSGMLGILNHEMYERDGDVVFVEYGTPQEVFEQFLAYLIGE